MEMIPGCYPGLRSGQPSGLRNMRPLLRFAVSDAGDGAFFEHLLKGVDQSLGVAGGDFGDAGHVSETALWRGDDGDASGDGGQQAAWAVFDEGGKHHSGSAVEPT